MFFRAVRKYFIKVENQKCKFLILCSANPHKSATLEKEIKELIFLIFLRKNTSFLWFPNLLFYVIISQNENGI